jgi:glycosyltransferase involved in cell wall biosynthesis
MGSNANILVNSESPKVSVVMSVYNAEKYLAGAIESILNQTFQDFEFIIVNDASTDSTEEILKQFDDPRIKIIKNSENLGLTESLNIGIKTTKGKYIARMDGDDISLPERLEKQFSFMEMNPAVGLLSSWYNFINETEKRLKACYLPVEDKTLRERLIHINQFCHGAAMIRKEALDTVGLYRTFFRYAQDYDLWLRISERYDLHNMPEILYLYRELDSAISSENLLLQSQFAGLAAEMAKQRRKFGKDAIEQGKVPLLPAIEELSEELRNYITESLNKKSRKCLETS